MCWACSVISRSSMRAAPAPGARLAPVTLPGRGVVVLMPEDPGCLRYQSGGGCETHRGNPLCMCPRGQVSACQSPPPRAGRSAVRRTQAASGGGMLTASSILPASPAGLAADQLLAPWGPCPRIGGVGTSAFSHPGRCRNDAAFASLAGTCPIPASSGRTAGHRLNRGGDRPQPRHPHDRHSQNARLPRYPGLHRPPHRRRQTIREIKRCLKRGDRSGHPLRGRAHGRRSAGPGADLGGRFLHRWIGL